jgi:hypothetical protein
MRRIARSSTKTSAKPSPPMRNVSKSQSRYHFSARTNRSKTYPLAICSKLISRKLYLVHSPHSSHSTRYLAIHHHLAKLIQRISTQEVTLRKANILLAREHCESFLKQLDSYDMLGTSDSRLLEAYSEDKANFSTANTRDAAARRDAKIARFREEKDLKRKLEVCDHLRFSRYDSRCSQHI